MSFIGDLHEGVERLAVFTELDVDLPELVVGVGALSDASVRDAFDAVAGLTRNVQKLETLLAGVIAQRSTRTAEGGGLAQTGGFRTPVQMVQEITGVPRGEAIRVVRVGSSLLETDAGLPGGPDGDPATGDSAEGAGVDTDVSGVEAGRRRGPWHAPLSEALLAGAITPAQHDAIRRGLGDPPTIEGESDEDVAAVWSLAASRLVDDASTCTVEDLGAQARAARDLIDPVGAQRRWDEHYEKRSFRIRTDTDGIHHGYITFDDEAAAFWHSVLDAALRPRRGGPRFVSAEEAAAARELSDDPRSNDQLAYDLIMDIFRTGTLADAKDVVGVRQPGVRVVTILDTPTSGSAGAPPTGGGAADVGTGIGAGQGTGVGVGVGVGGAAGGGSGAGVGSGDTTSDTGASAAGTVTLPPGTTTAAATSPADASGDDADDPSHSHRFVRRGAFGRLIAHAYTEDRNLPIPGGALETTLCATGTVAVTVDACGNPLNVGREHRLFTPTQRIALAIRDGGCMWPGCDRPASYTEAHHIDHWAQDEGKTDIDRGISLCRYHHLYLHNHGWRITSDVIGEFVLHHPPGDTRPPIVLRSKAPIRWLIDPPDRRPWRTAA